MKKKMIVQSVDAEDVEIVMIEIQSIRKIKKRLLMKRMKQT